MALSRSCKVTILSNVILKGLEGMCHLHTEGILTWQGAIQGCKQFPVTIDLIIRILSFARVCDCGLGCAEGIIPTLVF